MYDCMWGTHVCVRGLCIHLDKFLFCCSILEDDVVACQHHTYIWWWSLCVQFLSGMSHWCLNLFSNHKQNPNTFYCLVQNCKKPICKWFQCLLVSMTCVLP